MSETQSIDYNVWLKQLILNCESTRQWRSGLIDQHPDDTRNADAVQELSRLHEELSSLMADPNHDLRPSLVNAATADMRLLESSDSVILSKEIDEYLGGVGFRTPTPSAKDLLEFIEGKVNALLTWRTETRTGAA